MQAAVRNFMSCLIMQKCWLLLLGDLWWQRIYNSSWCETFQPRGPDRQSHRRLCRSARKAWREKGWYAEVHGYIFFLHFCATHLTFHVFYVRRMVLDLQHGSLTVATAFQKEWTPWLWSRRSLQMGSLSYLHLCCTLRATHLLLKLH